MVTKEGRIIKIKSDQFSVQVKYEVIVCSQKGNLRFANVEPLIGDQVVIAKDKYNHYQMIEIKPRKNFLIRPKVANVDQLLIVMAVDKPKFSSFKVMQYLLLANANNIDPVIIINKRDLIKSHPEVKKWCRYYRKLGYTAILVSNVSHKWWHRLIIKGVVYSKVSVLTGPSGVGKSTIINTLKRFHAAKTDSREVRGNWGRQITRHNELFLLNDNLIADTPGFSTLGLDSISSQAAAQWFTDILNDGKNCGFRNCAHKQENNCIIKTKINENSTSALFYNDYVKLLKRLQKNR